MRRTIETAATAYLSFEGSPPPDLASLSPEYLREPPSPDDWSVRSMEPGNVSLAAKSGSRWSDAVADACAG